MEYFLLGGLVLALLVASLYLLLPVADCRITKKTQLPPGSSGLPFIGESLDFFYAILKGHPEKFVYSRMVRHSPDVFKTSLLGDPMVVLCGAAGNRFLLTESNKLVKSWRPKCMQRLFSVLEAGVETTEDKAPVVAFVKTSNLRKLFGIMDGFAQRCLESQWHGQIAVYPLVRNYTFGLACRSFLSIEDPDLVNKMEPLMENVMSGILSLPINLPGTALNKAIKSANALNMHLSEIIKKQRAESSVPNPDLPRNLLSYYLETNRDDMDIAHCIIGVLVAAEETNYVIPLVFKYLVDYPDVYRRVYQENMEIQANKADGELLKWEDTEKLKYTRNVAREVMRMHPPVIGIFREVMADFTYAGYHIPKGFKIYSSGNAIHMDPKIFPNPGNFDPSRFEGDGPLPYTYIPFGGGSFICPGRKYAELSVLAFIHNAVKRFEWKTLLVDEKIVGNPFPVLSKGLPIILQPHDN